ncbi:MAG: SoxR reducing system RseC family protein [Flavobacteriaceae bacterium]|nr:SoxR reducing system RseC family protein [Flavobacteriaceae bacterium]
MESCNKDQFLNSNKLFRTTGVVESVRGEQATVRLQSNANCEGCKAQSACGVDSGDKIVHVTMDKSIDLNTVITVGIDKKKGLIAVVYAYVFPFLLVLMTLLIGSVFLSESMAGLLSLAILIPYYILLYFLRAAFTEKFRVLLLNQIKN